MYMYYVYIYVCVCQNTMLAYSSFLVIQDDTLRACRWKATVQREIPDGAVASANWFDDGFMV